MGRVAALLLLSLTIASCRSPLVARPLELAPAAIEPMARARALRTKAAALGEPERRATLDAALQAALAAVAAAPDEFRARVLVQDLELEIDPRGTRDRYANGPAEGATGKVLAARALLPDRALEARALLEQALVEDDEFAWAYYGLAFVEQREGRGDRARELCERALDADPTLVEALRLLADLCEGSDRVRAISARQLLVAVTGGDLAERHALAQLLLEADDRSDATDAVEELKAILAAVGEPVTNEARELARDCWLDMGTAYARRNRDPQALAAWDRALALDRECLTALYNVGVVELKRDRPEAALAAFEEYLLRAQSMTRSLPADQVFYRHFYVPNQVRALRDRLGATAAEVAPTLPPEAEAAAEGDLAGAPDEGGGER